MTGTRDAAETPASVRPCTQRGVRCKQRSTGVSGPRILTMNTVPLQSFTHPTSEVRGRVKRTGRGSRNHKRKTVCTKLHGYQESLGLTSGREVTKNDLQAYKPVSQFHRCSWHPLIPLGPVRIRQMTDEHRWRAEEIMPENVLPVQSILGRARHQVHTWTGPPATLAHKRVYE